MVLIRRAALGFVTAFALAGCLESPDQNNTLPVFELAIDRSSPDDIEFWEFPRDTGIDVVFSDADARSFGFEQTRHRLVYVRSYIPRLQLGAAELDEAGEVCLNDEVVLEAEGRDDFVALPAGYCTSGGTITVEGYFDEESG